VASNTSPVTSDIFWKRRESAHKIHIGDAAASQICGSERTVFSFETKPRKVALLKVTLDDIGMPNLGINFDPANLLYNNDEPFVLLDEMANRIYIVHFKDAVRPSVGKVNGYETVLEQGSTHFADLLKRLLDSGC